MMYPMFLPRVFQISGAPAGKGAALAALMALSVAFVPCLARAQTSPAHPGTAETWADGDQPAEEAAPETSTSGSEYSDTDPSALTDFQAPLAPYGNWVEDPTYGTVWVPSAAAVGTDFAPYQSAGHWTTNDTGDWMWASDYDWGYIPFHYGRWVWAGSYWGWIPGRVYAPAWVSWRVGDGGYIGWAPLPPAYYWRGGYPYAMTGRAFAPYCFVPTTHIFAPRLGGYVVHDRAAVATAAATTRLYRTATPTVGGGRSYVPASPTLAAAHVAPTAVTRVHAVGDPRALAYSTPRSTAAVRQSFPEARVHSAGMSSPRPYAGGGYSHVNPSRTGPSLYTPAAPRYHSSGPSAPVYHSAPAYHPQAVYRGGGSQPGSSYRGSSAPHSSFHSSGGHASGGRHR